MLSTHCGKGQILYKLMLRSEVALGKTEQDDALFLLPFSPSVDAPQLSWGHPPLFPFVLFE